MSISMRRSRICFVSSVSFTPNEFSNWEIRCWIISLRRFWMLLRVTRTRIFCGFELVCYFFEDEQRPFLPYLSRQDFLMCLP